MICSCKFRNPKATATAIIIKDNKVLLLKRNEEPFKGKWDFCGGYVQENELPEETLKREIKEELNVEVKNLALINNFNGIAYWQKQDFPIITFAYVVEIDGEIKLNDENSEYIWVNLEALNIEQIAFDSNQKLAGWVKKNFVFNIQRIKELVSQLDSSAVINEFYLYKAILDGYISKEYDNDKLIGMGWIFPRYTLLRKQAVIEDMLVDENYRKKGLGRKILKDLLKWAKDNNMDTIELTTNPKRIAANKLYKSEGFWLHETNHYLYNVK